jgi:BASS family bile acid:Na+ symporter
LLANARRLTAAIWGRLLLATFVLPPLLALALGAVLPVDLATLAGLYLIAVAPGAPLTTRNAATRGFDMQLAASYQVWGALVAPITIPLLVGGAAWLYGRDVWIRPREVLAVVAEKQFAPLLLGLALMHFAPAFSTKARRPMNVIGNVLLTIALVGLLWKIRWGLKQISPWVAFGALTLAVGCLTAARLLLPSEPVLAVSNVNRHVGLALLLTGAHFQNAQRAIPVIAAYAFAAPLVMTLSTQQNAASRYSPRRDGLDSWRRVFDGQRCGGRIALRSTRCHARCAAGASGLCRWFLDGSDGGLQRAVREIRCGDWLQDHRGNRADQGGVSDGAAGKPRRRFDGVGTSCADEDRFFQALSFSHVMSGR